MNKLIAGIALLAVGAVITFAYDFDDAEFNQILAGDLEELNAYIDEPRPGHPRSRRDEEAAAAAATDDKCRPWRKKRMCCAEETFEAMHEKDKDLKRECFKDIVAKNKDNKEPRGEFDPFRCDKIEKHRKEMICVMQCIGQKKDLLDDAGNPKEQELAAHIKSVMAKEEWFGSIQDKVISTCLAEAKNATAGRDASDTESCNPAGVKLKHCLFREIQLACPADQIKDQKACTKARDKIKRHNDFFPAPPSPFMNDE